MIILVGFCINVMVMGETMENITLKALEYLEQDYKTNISLIQVIRRNSAIIIECSDYGVLLFDKVSKSHLISADYNQTTISWIEKIAASSLFLSTDSRFQEIIKKRFGFTEELICYQYVDLVKEKHALDQRLKIVSATIKDKDIIASNYQGISEAELVEVIELGNLYLGYDYNNNLIGFIGSHLEGSIGLLKVLDAYRRNGYGEILVKFMINVFLDRGLLPFAQVEPDNQASMKLQEKIGLVKSEKVVGWLM